MRLPDIQPQDGGQVAGIGPEGSFRPAALPFRLPDIESETEADRGINLFAAPRAESGGVRVWLALPPGRSLQELDPETRERLKALGYVGPG